MHTNTIGEMKVFFLIHEKEACDMITSCQNPAIPDFYLFLFYCFNNTTLVINIPGLKKR